MITIPKEELLESLRMGYEEVKKCLAEGNDPDDIGHAKGFCVTIEQILSAYGNVSKEEMLKIKRPILGDMSLRRKVHTKTYTDCELETPTIFRKKNR